MVKAGYGREGAWLIYLVINNKLESRTRYIAIHPLMPDEKYPCMMLLLPVYNFIKIICPKPMEALIKKAKNIVNPMRLTT